jgi:isoleucyl-tRNA synthetase
VKLFTVRYANDTVLLAESNEEIFGVKNKSLTHSNSHCWYTATPIILVYRVKRPELYHLIEICLKGALITQIITLNNYKFCEFSFFMVYCKNNSNNL